MGKYYYVIKNDPEKLEKERERVRNVLNDRYKNDEEYREKCRAYSRAYKLKKKQEKEALNNTKISTTQKIKK